MNTLKYHVSRFCIEFNGYLISPYKEVKNPEEWLNCPKCGLKPIIWEFDNGRYATCGCKVKLDCDEIKEYDCFVPLKIRAESIMSVLKNSHDGKSLDKYNENELRDNWNHYCKTGEKLFEAEYAENGEIVRW